MSSTISKINITPLGENALVQRIESEEESAEGIYIPDSAKEKSQQATVIAVGPGKRNDSGDIIALEVRPGQRVLLSKYGGTEFKNDGEIYTIVKENDILAVFDI